MEKMKKKKKNEKYSKKKIHKILKDNSTQNLRRIPVFAVVVVTFFSTKSLAISMFFSECVFSTRKPTTLFWRDVVFPKRK